MKRKLISVFLLLSLIMCFSACNSDTDTTKNNIDWELEEEIENTERKVYDSMQHDVLAPVVASNKKTMIVQEIFPEDNYEWIIKENPSKKDGTYVQELVYDKNLTCRYEKILSKADNINQVSSLYANYDNVSFDSYSYITNKVGYSSFIISYTQKKVQYAVVYICGGKYNYIITYSSKAKIYSTYKDTLDKYIVSLNLSNDN